ncbi:MAG: hypothetical protein AUJ04_06730 [Acidobacteria bacterium 13_1_40CM_3_55_6]|nr:MAG: hypothetical protein AUJ04_06730 [Acidobacteria bacterium 13_1_40CM_3_55_6]
MVGFTEAEPGVLLRNITATAIRANPSIAKANASRLQYFLIVLLMTHLLLFRTGFPVGEAQKRPAKPGGHSD